jgi:hypothetical protein
MNDVLSKSQFASFFDVMFVSTRSTQFLSSPLADQVLNTKNSKGCALIAIETSKFLVSLTKDQKAEFVRRQLEFCASHETWERLLGEVMYI